MKQIRTTLLPGPKTIVAEDMEAFGEDCVLSFHLENINRTQNCKANDRNYQGVKDGGKEDECESIWKVFVF